MYLKFFGLLINTFLKKRLIGFLILSANILLIACKENSSKDLKPNTTITSKTILEQDQKKDTLYLPVGFSSTVVTEGVGPSRHLAINDNGDIYVKLRKETGNNGNMALRDTNGDGKADLSVSFGDYPNDGSFATEMRIHKGYLYFSSEQVIYRQKLTAGKLIPESSAEIILTDNFPQRWHNAKSLAFDNKGNMYVTFSAPTNACEDQNSQPGNVKGMDPCPLINELGGIWVFDEDKLNQIQTDGSLYATGLRSVVGISWNKQDNKLYAVQHGRDYLHNHAPHYYSQWDQSVLPAEEFVMIEKGDNFGWPYAYYDPFKNKKLLAPEYGGDGQKLAKGFKDPILGLPAHWAPNDLLFYEGEMFPKRYKNGAFIAFHGSTNRAPYPQAGYIVAFIPFKNGKATGDWEVFADGFIGEEPIQLMQHAKYRPMGLAVGPDGELYISESKKGKIWKIIFKGDKLSFGEKELQLMEKRKNLPHIKTPDEKEGVFGFKKK